jgi:hypothetical protein
VKLVFKSAIADCTSAGLNELINSSLVGVADGEDDTVADLPGVGALFGEGADEDAGDCANAFAIIKIDIATADGQIIPSINVIVSWQRR